MLKKTFSSFAILVMICSMAYFVFTEAQEEPTIQDNEVDVLVKQLFSGDDAVRSAAKVRLVELGPKAVRPLISLLKDLRNDPGPRFELGREKEGAEAWDHYTNLPIEQKSREPLDTLRGLEIGGRLRNDVYELLGRLHAEEAVPLLVEIMEHQKIDNLIPGMTPVMRALAELGPTAVPRVIESIDRAEITAASSPFVTAPDLSDEAKQRNLEWEITRIQENAVLVLEKIGDARALATLEKLLTATENELLARTVREAMKTIKNKHSNF
jgi:HEAT repeat protein